MTLKYKIKKCSKIPKYDRKEVKLPKDGYVMVEQYGDNCYSILHQRYELWGTSKKNIIERLEMMLKDLKESK